MKNQLRIIGGEWKRRQLAFASIEGLRPTPDRVRETLFNWLMWDIQNTQVLDLCAGSGALSFEALSPSNQKQPIGCFLLLGDNDSKLICRG